MKSIKSFEFGRKESNDKEWMSPGRATEVTPGRANEMIPGRKDNLPTPGKEVGAS
jgi:hypothetical protein